MMAQRSMCTTEFPLRSCAVANIQAQTAHGSAIIIPQAHHAMALTYLSCFQTHRGDSMHLRVEDMFDLGASLDPH